jgi:stage II sporulation protein D
MNIRFHYKCWIILFLCSISVNAFARKKISSGVQKHDICSVSCAHKIEIFDDKTPTDSSSHVQTCSLNNVIPQDAYETCGTATKPHEIEVRVLLDEGKTSTWMLHSESGFLLVDPLNPKKSISIHKHDVSISSKYGYIYIDGKRLTRNRVIVRAHDGNILFNGHEYGGSFYVICISDSIFLINCIDLEDYVASVLDSESWPSWPHEMHKVMAIAIRSYGVAMMMQAIANKRIYHVKNSVKHQVYGGYHKKRALYDAVTETSGIIMIYQNKPVIAMYDSCCGGVVTARMKGIDFVKAPYLARKTPCTFCKNCKIFSWTAEFEKSELTALLKNDIPNLSKIKTVTVSKKDAAGLVQQVSVKSAHGISTISGKKIFSLKPKIKSCCYAIENTTNKIIFRGRGYGHHVGLCQWGASQMIKDGYDCKKTLRFHYPGISFVKLVK